MRRVRLVREFVVTIVGEVKCNGSRLAATRKWAQIRCGLLCGFRRGVSSDRRFHPPDLNTLAWGFPMLCPAIILGPQCCSMLFHENERKHVQTSETAS